MKVQSPAELSWIRRPKLQPMRPKRNRLKRFTWTGFFQVGTPISRSDKPVTVPPLICIYDPANAKAGVSSCCSIGVITRQTNFLPNLTRN